MNRSKTALRAKRSRPSDDCLKNDGARPHRKRKLESEEISKAETCVVEENGDRGIKTIEIKALSLPDECSDDQVRYSTPLKKRRVVQHIISIEKVKAEPDQGGDVPQFNVCFRDIQAPQRGEYATEHDLLYEKILRKAEIWRKILPGGKEANIADDPEVIEKAKPPSYIHRHFLTYAIAKDIGERSTIFLKMRSLLLYAFKAVLLLLSAFGNFTTEYHYFSDTVSFAVKNCIFYNPDGQANTFEGINNLVDVKTYINDCFKVRLSKGFWGQVSVDDGVVLVTEPRFRQVRLMNRSCLISLYDDVVCHNSFSEESESKDPFGSGSPVGFVYSRSRDDIWFRGYYNTYNSHGFVYLLSDGDVLNQGWIDTSTAAFFIDFTLYSGDADLFCVVQLLFEFPLTGRVKSSYTARTFYLTRYRLAWGHFIFAVDIMFTVMILLETGKNFVNLVYFKWRVLRSVGLLYNCATTIFCWYAIYCLFDRYRATKEFLESRFNLEEEFIDFQPILSNYVHWHSIVVLTCLVVSFEVYGFLNIDLMSHLKITLQACLKNIVVFTIAFLIIVWGYVQVAYLLFAHSLERYRSFSRCFSELMRVQLGDLDYEGPRSVLKQLGPIFILAYVIPVVFVFVNMFFAITNATFTFVASNVDIEEESYTAFIVHCWRVLRVKYGRGYTPKVEEKKLKNSERIRNMLLDLGYSNLEIKMFFCRYIVDDDQALDEAVFERMWNLPIPPKRLGELEALVRELETAVGLLLYKAEWLVQRIGHIQETRMGKRKKSSGS